MKLTTEQLEKAKTAAAPEELLTFAKAEGLEMTEQEAADLFAKLNCSGELADIELGNVSGGVICGSDDEKDDFEVGDRVLESIDEFCPMCHSRVYIIERLGKRRHKIRCNECGHVREIENNHVMQKA